MDFVQELVSNFGHMATMKCKTCGEYKPFKDYDGSQWQMDRKKRQCKKCKPPKKAQTVAVATGTHAPTPVEQHGALGGQSAAAAGDGESVAASPPSSAVIHIFVSYFDTTSVNIYSPVMDEG